MKNKKQDEVKNSKAIFVLLYFQSLIYILLICVLKLHTMETFYFILGLLTLTILNYIKFNTERILRRLENVKK